MKAKDTKHAYESGNVMVGVHLGYSVTAMSPHEMLTTPVLLSLGGQFEPSAGSDFGLLQAFLVSFCFGATHHQVLGDT